MNQQRRLVPGRIVRYYVTGGIAVPAIITRVWNERCVNLVVFTDDDLVVARRTSVMQVTPDVEATGNLFDRLGQWEWPGGGEDGRQVSTGKEETHV